MQSDGNCQHWKGRGYCQRKYEAYMKKNCCKTCGSGGKKTFTNRNNVINHVLKSRKR